MAEQNPMRGVTAHITINGGRGQDALNFYTAAFGGEEVARHLADDGKRLMHAHMKINGGDVMLNDDFPEFHGGGAASEPAGFALHLEVDDADRWWKRALDAGATVHFPLDNQFWGARYGQVKDPFGHTWSIGGPIPG